MKRAAAGFAVALAVVCGVVVIAERTSDDVVETSRRVEHTRDVLDRIDDVRRHVAEAESSRRAHALDGEDAAREATLRALDEATRSLEQVAVLAEDNERQRARIAELRPLLARHAAEMRRAMDERARGPLVVDREVARVHEAVARSRQIGQVARAMIDDERTLLAERGARTAASIARTRVVVFGGIAVSIALVGAAVTILLRQIAQRTTAERRTRTALLAAQAANAELEAFSYSVSHDLRGPLRAINGFSVAVLEDAGDRLDDESRQHLERVRNAANRMGVLIDGLIDLARLTRAELTRGEVDVSALAEAVAHDLLEEAGKDRRIDVRVDPGLVAHGDERLIRAVLENLLANAIKFTSKRDVAEIHVGGRVSDGEVEISVRDNGAGFEEKYVDQLFRAFKRLHDAREFPGTGIGLATVERIVRRHGGTVRAEGKPGEGATFTFTLPR